jgi:hypothetical protein
MDRLRGDFPNSIACASQKLRPDSSKACDIVTFGPKQPFRNQTEFSLARGGELEQIQFLLGHTSVQTTEKYLGCKQRIRNAVNGRIGIEPRS